MVIVLKLMNGESVIGLLALDYEHNMVLQDPFILEYRVDLKGYRTMVLHRYNQFAMDNRVTFDKSHIITSFEVDDDLSDYYFYSLDHSIKFRDEAMSLDIQRASEYLQMLIDNNNNTKPMEEKEQMIPTTIDTSSNTVH
jgi:hypothetical protein